MDESAKGGANRAEFWLSVLELGLNPTRLGANSSKSIERMPFYNRPRVQAATKELRAGSYDFENHICND